MNRVRSRIIRRAHCCSAEKSMLQINLTISCPETFFYENIEIDLQLPKYSLKCMLSMYNHDIHRDESQKSISDAEYLRLRICRANIKLVLYNIM